MSTAAARIGDICLENAAQEYQIFVRQRIRRALILAALAAFIFLLLGLKAEAKGVALGGLFSVLSFYLLSRVVIAQADRQGWSGRTYGFVWVLVRLAILALPLILAAKSGIFDLAATAGGLFAVQVALFLDPLFSRLGRK